MMAFFGAHHPMQIPIFPGCAFIPGRRPQAVQDWIRYLEAATCLLSRSRFLGDQARSASPLAADGVNISRRCSRDADGQLPIAGFGQAEAGQNASRGTRT